MNVSEAGVEEDQTEEIPSHSPYIRSDIITKRILRYFRKYMCSISIQNKMICRVKKPITEIKNELIAKAKSLGILTDNDSDEKKEFLCWMFLGKKTNKVKKLFDPNHPSIQL